MTDGDTMIDKRTGEVLNPEVDSTYWKNNGKIIFIDHQITCCRVEKLHVLNAMGTLDT